MSMSVGLEGERAAARPMGRWRLAVFSTPCIPLGALILPVSVYLPDYYATELGVPLATLAFVFAAVRLFDLWFDPVIGLAMDATNTRIGRFRPWFLAGTPLALAAVAALFMPGPGISGGYILAWLVVGFAGQSMVQLGHMAWAAVAAPEYDQRSRVYGWQQGLTVFGLLAVLALPPVMKLGFGADHAQSIQAMGWFVIALMPLTLLAALFAAPEPRLPAPRARPRMRQYFDMLRRASVLRVLGADIAWGTAYAIAGALFFFYFGAVKGYDRGAAGFLLLAYFGGALAGAPVWTALARRMGKHPALAVAGAVFAAGQLALIAVPPGQTALALVTMIVAGAPFTAGPTLLRAMMADVGDEERLAGGADRTGLLFSLLTGSVKIGAAAAVGLGLFGLQLAGFDPKLGAASPPSALATLTGLFAVLPAALAILAAWLIAGHKLDAAAHAEIRRRLDLRDGLLHTPFE